MCEWRAEKGGVEYLYFNFITMVLRRIVNKEEECPSDKDLLEYTKASPSRFTFSL